MSQAPMAVRLNKDERARLDKLASMHDRSAHYLAHQAIKRFIDSEEEKAAELQLARKRWEQFALTGESVAHEDVRQRFANKANRADDQI